MVIWSWITVIESPDNIAQFCYLLFCKEAWTEQSRGCYVCILFCRFPSCTCENISYCLTLFKKTSRPRRYVCSIFELFVIPSLLLPEHIWITGNTWGVEFKICVFIMSVLCFWALELECNFMLMLAYHLLLFMCFPFHPLSTVPW